MARVQGPSTIITRLEYRRLIVSHTRLIVSQPERRGKMCSCDPKELRAFANELEQEGFINSAIITRKHATDVEKREASSNHVDRRMK